MMKNADFEKLNFDEGFGYEGEISIDFFGKDVNVDLTVNVEDEKIADIQYETYEKFKEKWNEFQKDVAERIIKYYNEEEKGSYGPDNKEEFDEYVNFAKSNTAYTIEESAQYGDELITLSTCSSHTDEGRFVVVAKKVK